MVAPMIPFNRPSLAGRELEYMAAVMERGHASGDGSFTKRCHALLEQAIPGSRALLTTSCTHALEMAALLLDIKPGDEVILPSFTFVSTANAFVLRGATPVFADIRPDTLNIDERAVARLITSRTRAIVAVHYAGVGCEMDILAEFASRHGLSIIEDNAHGLFGRYNNRALGSFGRLATLSFHETKNVSCGEGGALLINDPDLWERAEIIREKGTDRSRFFRGEVDKYTWVDLGSSYLPSELLAAFLCAQLEQAVQVQERRRVLWNGYADALSAWAQQEAVRLPLIPSGCQQPYHLFYLLMPDEEARNALAAHLRQADITAVPHYVPLHASPMARRLLGQTPACPVASVMSRRLLRLPLFASLSQTDQDIVIARITDWRGRYSRS